MNELNFEDVRQYDFDKSFKIILNGTRRINATQLIEILDWCDKRCSSTEEGHYIADLALLNYIGNKKVSDLFNEMYKWYA